jgi:leucyl aminopeptidase
MLSLMVHAELQRCGGYVFHDSMPAALAALHRLGSEPQVVGPQPSYALDNQARVQALMPQLQGSNLQGTVEGLMAFQNRRFNSTHGVNASNWLFNLWSQLNPGTRRDVRVTQITHTGFPQKSVMFEIIGSGNSGETVILGGHMDSIAGSNIEGSRAPGADDNASGIAALTEVIRVLMAGNYYPSRNLRFIAYAAEEVGLRGSGQIADDFLNRREAVVGVLQLDMTAYKSPLDAQEIWLYTDFTNAAQNAFLANLVATYQPGVTVGYSACGYGCSDHAAWHNRGFRASFPHEASNANFNRQIHTSNDVPAVWGNTSTHMLKFTQLALAYAVELASDGPPAATAAAAPAPVAAPRRAR